MQKFKVVLQLCVALAAAIGLAFGVDVLTNGACAVDSVLGLGVDQCVDTAAVEAAK